MSRDVLPYGRREYLTWLRVKARKMGFHKKSFDDGALCHHCGLLYVGTLGEHLCRGVAE